MIDPRMVFLYIIMEAVLLLVFLWLNKRIFSQEKAEEKSSPKLRDVLKGILERIFLIVGMLAGYPHVITAFAAIKIGTRFKNSKISNDFFLIGNLISILSAIIYVILVRNHGMA